MADADVLLGKECESGDRQPGTRSMLADCVARPRGACGKRAERLLAQHVLKVVMWFLVVIERNP